MTRKYALITILFLLCTTLTTSWALTAPVGKTNGKRRAPSNERVKLLHADTLYYNQMVNPSAKILVGKVDIEHAGTKLTCDSALYYEVSNSFDAFGHVKMRQGDTLKLDCDILKYNGTLEQAQARNNVILIHTDKKKGNTSTLYTDTLDYDKLNDVGYFQEGGRLNDGKNELVSDWGMYDLLTHDATFYYNVTLKSPANNPKTILKTDTLYYNTTTGQAKLVSLSNIFHGKDSIFTRRGFYDSKTEKAYLLGRSVVVSGNRRIVGDSIDYNGATRLAKAYGNVRSSDNGGKSYMDCDSVEYNDNTKITKGYGGVTYRDKIQQRTITCDYSTNNDATKITEGFGNVIVVDEKNNRRMLCDHSTNNDKTKITIGEGNVVFYDDRNNREMTCDRVEQNDNTKLTDCIGNVVYDDHKNQRHLTCDRIRQNDATKLMECIGNVDFTDKLKQQAIVCEKFTSNDKTLERHAYTNVYMRDFKEHRSLICDSVYNNDDLKITRAESNIIYTDSLNKNKYTGDYAFYNDSIGHGIAKGRALIMDFSQKDTLYAHADSFLIYTHNIRTDSVSRDLHAYHHVRAYRRDMQVQCDSMVYIGRDSCATLYKDPIIWQQEQHEQQLLGEMIHIWVNDSTIDSVYVVEQALWIEKIDTAHYNQLTSKEIHAYFQGKNLEHMTAVQNVLLKYYPFDDDSLMIGQNHLETTELRMFMDKNKKLDHLWAAASTGTLYPLILIPPAEMKLKNFEWFDELRPTYPEDVFNWREKGEEKKLHDKPKREPPKMELPDD